MTPHPDSPTDPIDAVPDPETVRTLLAEAIRRRDLLRSLLRLATRKANHPPPLPRTSPPNSAARQEVSRA